MVTKLGATHMFGRIFWTVYTGFLWKSTNITLQIDKIKKPWTTQNRQIIFLAFPLTNIWHSPKFMNCMSSLICSVTETVNL
jgi:hypothetical protein